MRTPASDCNTKRQQPTALPEHFFNRHHQGSEMIIYKITNRINGKIYIGQTTQPLHVRWSGHCSISSGCTYLHRAIQKYGRENFTVEEIDVASDIEEMNQKEIYWIQYCDSMAPKGYNMTSGGDGCFERCEASREKIRKRQTGKGNSFYGKTHNEEVRKRFSERSSGEKNPMYGSARFGEKNPMWGKHHSEETKRKISERFKGGKHPKARKVICVETGDEFESVSFAAKWVNRTATHVTACCRGRVPHCGGYHWRYIDGE